MKVSLLRAKIFEKKLNYAKCAESCGISKTTFANKMKDITKFSVQQAKALSELLQLTDEETFNIFLS